MTRVLVLGITGMLGHMVARVLAQQPDIELAGTARGEPPARPFPVERFDARADDASSLFETVEPDWIVNAIGVTNARIDPTSPEDVDVAREINGRFPFALAAAAAERGARVIQIASDGVFSGSTGGYREDAPHDALDVYGQSKSLGEVPADNVTHLRCSIVGPERAGGGSLVEWLASRPRGSRVPGYTNHVWNGVTTWHFGRLCEAIVRESLELPSPLHVVPGDAVTKAELLELIARAYDRDDLLVDPQLAPKSVDRSLATLHPEANARLWRAAGYVASPTVREMVDELGRRAAR